MKYKQGQIYFWNSTSDLFGKAIRLYNMKNFKESKTSHCGIISEVTDKQVIIYEAGENGFLPSRYDKSWLEQKIKEGVIHIGETKEELTDVLKNCKKYEGIRYGYLDIIGIGLNYLFGWKLLGITGKNAIICSEAVSRVIYDCSNKIDFAKEYKIKFDAVTPMHIYKSKQVKIL